MSYALRHLIIDATLGGAILIASDCTQETFKPTTGHGGEDGSGRSARYLEWAYDEDLQDEQITVEMIYILKEQGKPAQIHHETWQEGLFSEATWLTLLKKAGLSCPRLWAGNRSFSYWG